MRRSNFMATFIGLLCILLVTKPTISKENDYIKNNPLLQDFIDARQLKKEDVDFDISNLEEHVEHDGSMKQNRIQSHDLHRKKRSGSIDTPIQLSLKAYGEEFTLELWHVQSVLDLDAAVVIRAGDGEETKWTGNHPDCFLRGMVTSHGGTASMSYCDELVGTMNDGINEYHIETLPKYMLETGDFSGNLLVARRNVTTIPLGSPIHPHPTEFGSHYGRDFNTFRYSQDHDRQRRSTSNTSFEIETALYVDQKMYEYMNNVLQATTTEKKIELLMLTWNGIQAEYSKDEQLGYNVTILIKNIVFYSTNPSWYNSSTVLTVNLYSICNGTKHELAYDHVHLHTGESGTTTAGFAYVSGACSPSLRCAVSAIRTFSSYYISAHELGHTLSFNHDADVGCPAPNDGIMGSKGSNWSTCSKAALATFIQSGSASCLFATNIAEADVPANLVNISLSGLWMGMMYTDDEYCEYLHGSGWRFREFPYWNDCSMHSCVDMNTSSLTYGKMENYLGAIPARYCGDGKVCIGYENCDIWSATGLDLSLFTVVPGGWGQWGSWTSCSRTCGRGIMYRQRKCDNPKPRNAPECKESEPEYDAIACNTASCGSDSSDIPTLKKQRAGETCALQIAKGLFNSTVYDGTGDRFFYSAQGQCEVNCNVRSGYTSPGFQRFGLMPDGTTCTSTATLNVADTHGYPRVSGVYGACVQGYCESFGCDNSNVNMLRYDGCGVCGGDNTTCNVYEGVFTDPTTQGNRTDMAWLPNGTYNIQFYFTWNDMQQVYIETLQLTTTVVLRSLEIGENNGLQATLTQVFYQLELWSKDNQAVLVSWVTTSFIFDSQSNPTSFAGTFWTFLFVGQFLYATGPINEPVLIKLYQRSNNSNTGVYYGYSTPLSSNISTCSGTCVNGVWNSTLCGCICNTGYYGTTCNTTCNKICYNGGILNTTTCVCQCTQYWFGTRCTSCRNPYSGPTCTACKYTSCLNCGTFNNATCRCECLAGYGGLQCGTTCNNTLSTCTANAAAGKCVTDNINMETNCNLACGLCVAQEPQEYCATANTTSSPITTTTPSPITTSSPTANCNSTCPWASFTCDNCQCESLNVVYDGNDNCSDGSESRKKLVQCPWASFTCDNCQCESLDVVCDGNDNCGDGSDESKKKCSGSSRQEVFRISVISFLPMVIILIKNLY